MPNKQYLSIVASVVLAFSGAASAKVRTFEFTGTVTYAADSGFAAVGALIRGRLSYDDKARPAFGDAGFSSYVFPESFAMSATVAGHTIVADTLRIDLWNNYGGNVEDFVNIEGGPILVDNDLHVSGSFGLMLASPPGATKVLKNAKLPSSYEIEQFNSPLTYGWLQSDGSQTGTIVHFSVDSIVVVDSCHERNDRAAGEKCSTH